MSLRRNLEKLNSDYWQNDVVSIRPIKTEAEFIYAAYDCKLTPKQQELVNPAWFSVGRAYLAPEDNLPCLIYHEETPIGFINFSKWLASGDAYSWSYFIGTEHQGKGYGKAAARLAVSILKAADPEKVIKLATESCNEKAQKLYTSLGFTKLPELDGDDLVFGYK